MALDDVDFLQTIHFGSRRLSYRGYGLNRVRG